MNVEYVKELLYEGRCKVDYIMSFSLKREWYIIKRKIRYDIQITTIFNIKTINIKASDNVRKEHLINLLFDLLRYECIWDGCFFATEKVIIDNKDVSEDMKDKMLSFYCGNSIYFPISQPLDDKLYKKGFGKWKKYDKKNRYLIQMFFYATYTDGITMDLRISLLTEIFEPLSKILEEDGKIVVENSQPIKVKKIICPVCKEKIDVETKCSPSFKDCVMSIIKIYGERIFLRENIAVLCQRLVNTRNKVLHLDKDKKDCLTGKQCGFYTKKIVMLIRLIIITECEVFEYNAWEQVIKEIERFDKRFAKCRVKE